MLNVLLLHIAYKLREMRMDLVDEEDVKVMQGLPFLILSYETDVSE